MNRNVLVSWEKVLGVVSICLYRRICIHSGQVAFFSPVPLPGCRPLQFGMPRSTGSNLIPASISFGLLMHVYMFCEVMVLVQVVLKYGTVLVILLSLHNILIASYS